MTSAAEFPPETPAANLPTAVAWGSNKGGAIGDGTVVDRKSPVLSQGGTLLDGKEIAALSTDNGTSCAIADGELYCWGYNYFGQVGMGKSYLEGETFMAIPSPTKVVGFAPTTVGDPAGAVTAVDVGTSHTCAIADGRPYCWGFNDYGALGTGNDSFAPYTVPTPQLVDTTGVLAGKHISAISAGTQHTCVIADGAAYCWGWNKYGQLGLGYELPDNDQEGGNWGTSDPVPVNADGILKGQTVTSISAGDQYTCATAAGRAYCWGHNFSGNLGINSDPNIYDEYGVYDLPQKVYADGVLAGLTVHTVSAGSYEGFTTCALAGIGTARQPYCWGSNNSGALGNGKTEGSTAPVAVSWTGALAGKSASSLSVGMHSACVVVEGKGYCWGNNTWGQLGTGDQIKSNVPVPVSTAGVLHTRRLTTINSGWAVTSAIAVTQPEFTDVKTNNQFYDNISWIAGSGIAQGYGDGSFKPGNNIARQAMAAFVYRFKNPGMPDPICVAGPRKFTDVPTNHPFCGAIEWLVAAQIVTVAPDEKFNPSAAITRDVMADWIYRNHHPGVADQPCSGQIFIDVTVNSPSCGNIEWLTTVGVASGYNGGGYQPSAVVSRAAMSAFLHRARELTTH